MPADSERPIKAAPGGRLIRRIARKPQLKVRQLVVTCGGRSCFRWPSAKLAAVAATSCRQATISGARAPRSHARAHCVCSRRACSAAETARWQGSAAFQRIVKLVLGRPSSLCFFSSSAFLLSHLGEQVCARPCRARKQQTTHNGDEDEPAARPSDDAHTNRPLGGSRASMEPTQHDTTAIDIGAILERYWSDIGARLQRRPAPYAHSAHLARASGSDWLVDDIRDARARLRAPSQQVAEERATRRCSQRPALDAAGGGSCHQTRRPAGARSSSAECTPPAS
jgi:hypothetical protein